MLRLLLLMCGITIVLLPTKTHTTEHGCLYGWQLSKDKKTCFIDCTGPSPSQSNVYCHLSVLLNVQLTYNSSRNSITMQPSKLLPKHQNHLPSCYNVTLNSDDYNITPNGLLDIGINYFKMANYQLSSGTSSDSVTFCYPLTPQLLQCDTDVTENGLYYIVNGTELRIPSKNLTAYLGDFYIMKNGSAVTCENNVNINHVQFNNIPRCNYVTVASEDIIIDDAGAMLITIANFTIKNPVYSIITGQMIQVCIPLSQDFGSCPNFEQSVQNYYEKESNLNVYNIEHSATFTPDSYFITIKMVMTFCYKSSITFDLYGIIGFIAGACLIFTILIRLKFFLQNYHCKCLMCHIIAFILMFMSFAPRMIFLNVDVIECYFSFSIDYYFMMATYTWLNIVSYDSWRHFSKLQTTPKGFCDCSFGGLPKYLKGGLFRFIMYSLYAWGLPAILITTILTFGLESSPYDFHTKFIPYIEPGCNFTNMDTFAIYYFFPESLFTTITIIFLIKTIHVIRAVSRGTELVNQQRRSQIFRMSMKMIAVMGICWPINCAFYFPTIIKPELILLWYGAAAVVMVQGFIITFIYFDRNETMQLFQSIYERISLPFTQAQNDG